MHWLLYSRREEGQDRQLAVVPRQVVQLFVQSRHTLAVVSGMLPTGQALRQVLSVFMSRGRAQAEHWLN
jgi:hypothetical protein